MTQLTNGKHPCVLVFVSVVDILNILCDYQFVFSVPYLMNFIFNTMLDAACNILRVHCMKCDLSFSLGSLSTLFRRGGHLCHVCVKHFFLLTTVQNYKNRSRFSRVIITNVLPPFLWFTVYFLCCCCADFFILN